MNGRDAMIVQLTTRLCDVLTCDQRVPNGVDVCSRHRDGGPVTEEETTAAVDRLGPSIEGWLGFESDRAA